MRMITVVAEKIEDKMKKYTKEEVDDALIVQALHIRNDWNILSLEEFESVYLGGKINGTRIGTKEREVAEREQISI